MATFEVRRPGVSDYIVNDLGQIVGAGGTIDLLVTHDPEDIGNSPDLDYALSIAALIRVKNSLDVPYAEAFDDLGFATVAPQLSTSIAESIGRLAEDEASEARSEAQAGEEAGSIAVRAESLSRTNSPSEAASIATRAESFALIGDSIGDRAESIARVAQSFGVVGDSIADLANGRASEATSIGTRSESIARLRPNRDLPCVTASTTSQFNLSTAWQDIPFPSIDQQNATGIVERDPSNTDRILIKEAGIYIFSVSMPVYCPAVERVDIRVRKNDLTVLPGSTTYLFDSATQMAANCFSANLAANDFITVQAIGQNTSEYVGIGSIFTVIRAGGIKGDQGTSGSGTTLNIRSRGASLPNTPHSALDFLEPLQANDAGSGVASVSTAFGPGAARAASDEESQTTSASWQQKLRLTVNNLTAGTYRLGWYAEMRGSNIGSDFNAQVQQDDTTTLMTINIEPKDSNSRYPISGFAYVTLAASTTYNFDFDYDNEAAGDTAYIRRCRLELWRVG